MSLIDDVMYEGDKAGKEVQQKRAANEAAKQAAEKAETERAKQQKQHEEDKKQGMI